MLQGRIEKSAVCDTGQRIYMRQAIELDILYLQRHFTHKRAVTRIQREKDNEHRNNIRHAGAPSPSSPSIEGSVYVDSCKDDQIQFFDRFVGGNARLAVLDRHR